MFEFLQGWNFRKFLLFTIQHKYYTTNSINQVDNYYSDNPFLKSASTTLTNSPL